jgi:5-formyltetrahydrofolate cyclo-ligase
VLPLVPPISSGPRGPNGKSAARRDALARRDAIPAADRDAASAQIAAAAAHLLTILVPHGGAVALYSAKGSEVDTTELDTALRALGFAIAYPRVVAGTRVLAFHAAELDQLAPSGRLGLREPSADATVLAPSQIAAYCMPGLAFDRTGGRIGWGLGHYDATLAAAPSAMRIGLAFEAQLVAAVPREAHDIGLHAVVTETAVYDLRLGELGKVVP